MKTTRISNIWDALEDTPQEAQNMKMRADLMMNIRKYIQHSGLGQDEAAKKMGVTQPRVSDLMRGKINLFTIDTLTNMAVSLGLKVELRILEAA